ncbi:MAG: hypothetical protein EPO09_16165 [Aquabacterium sp.]|uniref:DUF5672 family protein n=1 Tax=Aquabacterium sp. TaxID=1872578 RepID=UPI00120F6FAB|nr:DUF5672 family protein [Aquabacterium sp.]TAK91309.1 MAG: hypothetical protein EPO09_16165 [Aquabacterium sp.]
MLNLPQITLCCVDTRLPQMALDAMKICMSRAQFGDALLFTRPQHGLQDVPPGIKVIEVDTIRSIEAYSHFLLKEMGPYLHTSHMLIVQWDGYVVDPGMWRDDFLSVDYIGAVWPQYNDAHRVGNGGFSLRSRKLLDALAHDEIVPHHPEDTCIARTYRTLLEQRWGIRFADEAMAHQFAFERERGAPRSFGFHGLSNFVQVLPANELEAFVEQAPAEMFISTEGRKLIKAATRAGLLSIAGKALSKRRTLKKTTLSELRLAARLAFKKAF